MPAILGQPRAVHLLGESMRRAHVAHAWIFHGPYGVGKATTALAFARLLLDPETTPEHVERFEPPAGTETARLIESGIHPDLHMISRSLAARSDNAELRRRKLQNIPIDLLREFVIGGACGDGKHRDGPISRSAVLGHGKVFVIDEAELLDAVGQNALLKTLEEPPPRTYIILLTTREDRLLPTIRSRCQRVPFLPLDADAMNAWMHGHGLALDGAAAAWTLAFASGSPGTAVFAARHDLQGWVRDLGRPLDQLAEGAIAGKIGDGIAERIDALAKALVKEREGKARATGAEDDGALDDADADDAAGPRGKASKQSANLEATGWMIAALGHEARIRLAKAVDTDGATDFWTDFIELLAEAERAAHDNVNLKHVCADLVARAADRAGMRAASGGAT